MAPKALPPTKINPTKLLGGTSFAAKKISVGALQDENITIPKKDLIIIKTQVIKIKDLIKSSTLLKSAEIERKRKDSEKERFSKKEQELETPQNKEEGGKEKVPSLPKLGFLDRIKKFFFNVLLGYVVVRLLPHVNKLPDIVKTVGSAIDFGTDLALGLFNGLVTFIDWGYKAYDATRGFIKTIGGDSTLKVFDAFNGAVGKVIEAAIITSIAIGSQGDGGVLDIGMDMLTDRLMKKGVQQAATGATQAAGSAGGGVGQAAGVGAGAAAGIIAGAGLLASALGEGAFQLKKMSVGMEQGAKKSYDSEKNPLMKPIRWLMYQGAKFISFQLGTVGSLLDIVGTPFRYAIELIRYPFLDEKGKKEQNKNLSKFDARIREQFREGLNALSFGMIGGSGKGSWGSLFGEKGTKGMGYAGGGSPVTRGGKVQGGVKRTVKKAKRSLKVQAPKVRPGASVGGEKKIEKVFPENKDTNKVNPLGYMKKSYDTLSSTSGFGGLFGIALKAQLGEKPSDLDYKIAASGLSAWMQNNLATGGAFAEGGSVDAAMFGNSEDMKNVIAKSLEETISKKVDDAINNLMRQLGLKEGEKKSDDKKSGPDGGGGEFEVGPAGTSGDKLTMARNLMRDLGLTADQAAGIVGNMAAESGVENARVQDTPPGTKGVLKVDGKTGYGIVQWTSQGRQQALADYAKSKGADLSKPLSMDIEYQFFLKEFKGKYGHVLSQIKQAPDVKTASTIFMQQYEVPAGYKTEAKIMERYNMSKPIYDKLAKGEGKATEGPGTYIDSPTNIGKSNVIQYVTGDVNYKGDGQQFYYDLAGHGLPGNYHDHIAFSTIENKEKAKKVLRSSGIQIGSEYRAGDRGYHGKNLAIDVPGAQWGGSGAIGQKEFAGSRKVRQVLGIKAYFRGGRVSIPTFATLAEKGPEFVFDADTTRGLDGMAPLLLEKLNVAKTKPQLASILQSYAGYESGAEKVVEVPTAYSQPTVVPVPVPMPMGGGGMSGGSSDSSYDSLYM